MIIRRKKNGDYILHIMTTITTSFFFFYNFVLHKIGSQATLVEPTSNKSLLGR